MIRPIRPDWAPCRRTPHALAQLEHTAVIITHGRDAKAEDVWLDENIRNRWCRTRYEDFVDYRFENATEALHFKMRFG